MRSGHPSDYVFYSIPAAVAGGAVGAAFSPWVGVAAILVGAVAGVFAFWVANEFWGVR